MRTMIVRLRRDPAAPQPVELDIQGGPAYALLRQQFRADARPLTAFLEGARQTTRVRYKQAFAASDAGELDILSSMSPVAHGVADYQELAPSRAVAVTATEDVLRELLRQGYVDDVHPNYLYELPDLGPAAPALEAPDVLGGADGDPLAWHLDHARARGPNRRSAGQGVKAVVLDTGIDLGHREFRGRTIPFVEWDALGKAVANPTPRDTHGHGTHVAGILCGDTVGVAPAVTLGVGLVAPGGVTTFAQLNRGLEWAAQQGAHVVNLSVGKKGYAGELEEMMKFAGEAGMLVVAAVGNDGPGNHRSPGDYRAVVSVGAVSAGRQAWKDGARGSGGGLVHDGTASYRKPDLYAPGVDVYSSWAAPPADDYQRCSGTSMAAPVVAGAAAVLKGREPGLTADDLRVQLLQNCDVIPLPAALGGSGLLLTGIKNIARKDIERLAHQKFLARGGLPGDDQRDWYEAVRGLPEGLETTFEAPRTPERGLVMKQFSQTLMDYLESSGAPKQVLLKVLAGRAPQPGAYSEYKQAAEANRIDLMAALKQERASDRRVEFEPLGVSNQVALKAPPDVILKIARRPDVVDVAPDAPEDAL